MIKCSSVQQANICDSFTKCIEKCHLAYFESCTHCFNSFPIVIVHVAYPILLHKK